MLPRRVEGGWQIGEFWFAENPRFTVPGWCERLVQRWAMLRQMGGGFGGGVASSTPLLPCAGGFGDQQAMTMDAFAMFDKWAAQRGNSGGQ